MVGGGEGDGGVDVVPLQGHCSVLWLGASVTATFEGVDVMPLLGAHGMQKKHPEKLPWASCRRYTNFYIDKTKIVFCYLGSILVWFFFCIFTLILCFLPFLHVLFMSFDSLLFTYWTTIFVVVRFDVETAGWRHFRSGGTALSEKKTQRFEMRFWEKLNIATFQIFTLQIKSRALGFATKILELKSSYE